MTNIVVLMNDLGASEMTDAERAALEEILNDSGYRLPDDGDWGDGNDMDVEWSVRATRRGEAEGDYYRRPDGTLQILGYSLEPPEGLSQAVNDALARLVDRLNAREIDGYRVSLVVDDLPRLLVYEGEEDGPSPEAIRTWRAARGWRAKGGLAAGAVNVAEDGATVVSVERIEIATYGEEVAL